MSETTFGWRLFVCVASLMTLHQVAGAGELTFELPDNEEMCFYEFVDKGVECVLEFQVQRPTRRH